jgi:hypothetical protein
MSNSYDSQLRLIVAEAVSCIYKNMDNSVPFMAQHVAEWMQQLSGTSRMEDYFLHPIAFPMFLLPWWVEKTLQPSPDATLQRAIAYSTANGYYYIRLIDNLMDGDTDASLTLLPTLNFFHSQFQHSYYNYFPSDHPFWHLFHQVWWRSGESAMEDAYQTDIDLTRFQEIAAQKVCAAKIPIAAVCYYHQQPELIQPWSNFVDLLGCWHQMTNDLFDWIKDSTHHSQTYFLCEAARQKLPQESLTKSLPICQQNLINKMPSIPIGIFGRGYKFTNKSAIAFGSNYNCIPSCSTLNQQCNYSKK